jgi:hypothetical protein
MMPTRQIKSRIFICVELHSATFANCFETVWFIMLMVFLEAPFSTVVTDQSTLTVC